MIIINKLNELKNLAASYFASSSATSSSTSTTPSDTTGVAQSIIAEAAKTTTTTAVKPVNPNDVKFTAPLDRLDSTLDQTKVEETVQAEQKKATQTKTNRTVFGFSCGGLFGKKRVAGQIQVAQPSEMQLNFAEKAKVNYNKASETFNTKVWNNPTLDKAGEAAKTGTKGLIVVIGAVLAVVAAPFIVIGKMFAYVYNKAIKPAALFVYNKAILPAAKAIKSAIVWTYNKTLGVLFAKIGNAFKAAIKSIAKALVKALIEVVKEDATIRADLNNALNTKEETTKKVVKIADAIQAA